jgi:hypothetical protein
MTWANGLLLICIASSVAFIIARTLGKVALRRRRLQLRQAYDLFHLRREWLEAQFITAASSSGRPRGLEWVDCGFDDDDVVFARDRQNGGLRAFVAVTISFEAIPGGGMEDVEAVGNLRAATAVFRCDDGTWTTDGRTIFNLNPEETIRHFGNELELVS